VADESLSEDDVREWLEENGWNCEEHIANFAASVAIARLVTESMEGELSRESGRKIEDAYEMLLDMSVGADGEFPEPFDQYIPKLYLETATDPPIAEGDED
jgi:hypothetical protein